MAYSEFELSFMDSYARREFPGLFEQSPAKQDQPAAESSAGAGSISAIPQTRFEKMLEQTGMTLEQVGMELDKLGKVNIGGVELGLRDFLPFVGSSEKRVDPLTGKEEVVQVGTPQALQKAGRGESLVRGTGMATQLVPDAKLALFDAPTVGAAAKVAGRGINKAATKIGDIAVQAITGNPAATAVGVLEEAATMPSIANIINPRSFNPKTEIKSAIDTIAANPDTAIYVPQAQRAPSVALRVAKPELAGSGDKGTITVADVGAALERTQLAFNRGKVLDPANPKDLVKMIDSASAEAEFQLSQPISGATWYEDDVTKAFQLSSKVVPQLATDEDLRVLTTAFAASTSYNKRAGENWAVATRIADHLMKTGTVAARNPDNGKLWGGTTGPIMEQQLKLHEFMINKMGLDGYSEWLLSPHTVKEIVAMRAESGLYKTPGIPGKANDLKMGAFIMGEKGGAFFLNLNGIKETTADKWFTRTYNRHTGTLTSGPISEQGLVDAPRNESERMLMKTWNRAVAQNVSLDEQANQAVLWYFEQNLYYNLGVKSAKSESFSDGAKNLLNARGIAFDDAGGAGAASGSNAGEAATKPTGPAGAGNRVGSGAAASAQSAKTTTVRRGQAPAMGAE